MSEDEQNNFEKEINEFAEKIQKDKIKNKESSLLKVSIPVKTIINCNLPVKPSIDSNQIYRGKKSKKKSEKKETSGKFSFNNDSNIIKDFEENPVHKAVSNLNSLFLANDKKLSKHLNSLVLDKKFDNLDKLLFKEHFSTESKSPSVVKNELIECETIQEFSIQKPHSREKTLSFDNISFPSPMNKPKDIKENNIICFEIQSELLAPWKKFGQADK